MRAGQLRSLLFGLRAHETSPEIPLPCRVASPGSGTNLDGHTHKGEKLGTKTGDTHVVHPCCSLVHEEWPQIAKSLGIFQPRSSGEDYNLSASLVFLHQAMGFHNFVQVEGFAYLNM
jgi:hypothetical protein